MDFVHSLLLFLHLLGMAGIIAGWLMQAVTAHAKSAKVLLHSSLTQLLTGLLLVGVLEMGTEQPDHIKIGVKLLVAVVVSVLGLLNLRKPASRLALAAGVLTIVNIGIAVFW